MNILVVSQYYYPEPFRIHEICEELALLGNKVTVFTTFPNYPEGEIYEEYKECNRTQENINGVRIIRFKSSPRKSGALHLAECYLSFWLRGNSQIKKLYREKFDVIFFNELSPITSGFPAIKIKKKQKIPLYLYCLDLWPEAIKDHIPNQKSLIYKLTSKVSGGVYKSADIIGVTSRSFIDYLSGVHCISKEKTVYLPQHSDDIAAGTDLAKEPNKFTDLLFAGNVGESQSMETLVDAVSRLTDIPYIRVHIVGTGSSLDRTKEIIKNRNLDDKFVFYGRQPYSEMKKFYKAADACLLTLSGKTLAGMTIPGKLQNYMAAGKPIIAAINGDASDIIRESKCGIASAADDSAALADAIRSFISNRNEWQSYAANSRKYYETHFTIGQFVSELNRELLDLADKR